MKKVFLLLLAITFIGCKRNKSQSKNEDLKLNLISKGNLHGAGAEGISKQNTVIKSESEWQELLSKMNAVNQVSNSFSQTDIDFSNYIVIAVFDEVKSTGGHSLGLNLKNTSDEIIINIIQNAPDGMATTVMTQPYYLAKVPKSEKPIVFK